jgi:two-component system alkaline phosphatase synthesis response regulator PhoP
VAAAGGDGVTTPEPKRVLLVEDDRVLRRAGEAALHRCGLQVLLAADGEEAIARARRERPDLVLLDILMPRRSGMEVIRELRAHPETKDIRILVLSNSSRGQDVTEALDLGVEGYWVKAEMSLRQLGDRVMALLEERQ